jgi:hypothetical protein
VARDVGQALLRDAVDRQLLFGSQVRHHGRDLVAHRQAAVLREAGGERDQGAAQAELVQRLRAQPAGKVPHLLGALPRGLLHLLHGRLKLRWRATSQPVELEHHSGQGLSQLIVEFARQPASLPLLGGQRPLGALAPLALEPVQHVIEGVEQLTYLGRRAVDVDPPTRRHRIHPPHQLSEAFQRPEEAPQQREVDRHDDEQPRQQHRDLGSRRRRADRGRREDQDQRSRQKNGAIDRQHAPEQRHGPRVAPKPPAAMGGAPH